MRGDVMALVATLAGCTAEPAPRPAASLPTRSVQVASAKRATRPVVTEVVGTVRAVRSATIGPVVGGTVAEVRVGLGSSVRPGEVLVRLSAREIDARLEQARAVKSLARTEHDRAAALHAQDAISSAQYDAARSQLEVAEAAQAEASTMADKTVLRAPFAGVVTAKMVNVGDTAMPGQALLVVEAPDALRFEARVPEAAARGLAAGGSLALRLDGEAAELDGRVAEIEPTAEAATRTVLVKIDLPRVPGLHAGRFGRLLVGAGTTAAVTVATSAVVRRGQLDTVFVVEAGVARLRLVRTARQTAGRVEVASGLAGGELVVVADASDLVDGQPVAVRP